MSATMLQANRIRKKVPVSYAFAAPPVNDHAEKVVMNALLPTTHQSIPPPPRKKSLAVLLKLLYIGPSDTMKTRYTPITI